MQDRSVHSNLTNDHLAGTYLANGHLSHDNTNYITNNQFTHDIYDFNVTKFGFIVERKPDPGWKIQNHINNEFNILAMATSGEAIYEVENKRFVVKKNDILFFSKGFPHTAQSSSNNPWSFYSVAFDIDVYNNSENMFADNDYIIFPPMPILASGFNEMNSLWIGKRPGYLIKCRSILLNILYTLIRETHSRTFDIQHYKKIDNIINLIQKNYMKSYSVEELANIAGLSSSHFRLIFKKITGMSVIQYQNYVKINVAKDLLMSNSCNVTEAALATGFSDIYYFSRLFKKITGQNPSKYLY
jgi:AraC-like DNA-binding protein